MDEMIRYIFGSLRCSETTTRVVIKTMRKQRTLNNFMTLFAVLTTLNLLVHKYEFSCLHGQIETLKKDIENLKKTEGD